MYSKLGYSTILAMFLVVFLVVPCQGSLIQESPEVHEGPEDDQNRSSTKYIRLKTDEFGNPVALQTATIWFEFVNSKGEKQEVILEGVIHVADPSYFRGFEQRFLQYDRVLYESLLKPRAQESGEDIKLTGLQMLQQLSIGTLGLAYQFDEIDYESKNMRNADLSTEEIAERMKRRGESTTTLFSDLVTHLLQKANSALSKTGDGESDRSSQPSAEIREVRDPSVSALGISVLTDQDGIMKIRRAMAGVLVGSGLLESPLPPGIHQVIVGDRNDEVASVLDEELDDGTQRIAIFFGVAHMSDMEQRLLSEFEMKKTKVIWRNAWDLRDDAVPGAPLEGLVESTFRDSFKNKLKDMARGLGKDKKPQDSGAGASDETIRSMEERLKALQARLDELEGDKSNTEKERDPSDDKKDDRDH